MNKWQGFFETLHYTQQKKKLPAVEECTYRMKMVLACIMPFCPFVPLSFCSIIFINQCN